MECLALVRHFFRILKFDTRAMGRFSDVVREVISVRKCGNRWETAYFWEIGGHSNSPT